MTAKRCSASDVVEKKKMKLDDSANYLYKCLSESGLSLKMPPEKCIARFEIVQIIRNLSKNIQKHYDYPRNVPDLFNCIKEICDDLDLFKHFLYPNIVMVTEDGADEYPVGDSVVKILLNVGVLQSMLTDYIFDKATDLAIEGKCGQWIQMILKNFVSLDNISCGEQISMSLIKLLDISTETLVRLEILTTLPDLVDDQQHSSIAEEVSKYLGEYHDLTPAILDCLSYLYVSGDQYKELQHRALNILMTLPNCNYFPNYIKFLLLSGDTSVTEYLDVFQVLRSILSWPTSDNLQEIETSQVLTAIAMRNSLLSSKVITSAWFKVLSNCKVSTDHEPFDFIILLIMYSISEDKQRQVEKFLRKQIKGNILPESVLQQSFEKYKPILKKYLQQLIELTNSLLKSNSDPEIESFASNIYCLMLVELEECRQTIIAELLKLGLDRKQCTMSILGILNTIANKDIATLKPYSIQMLTFLDRMDVIALNEVREIMNLICGLAYSFENSIIKDDIYIMIRKQLGSSNPRVKIQGIIAAVYSVKYVATMPSDNEPHDDISETSKSASIHLPDGDVKEACLLIELISRSTKQFPDLICFYYDELSNVISATSNMNEQFLDWLTKTVIDNFTTDFIVDSMSTDSINDIKITVQYCLNEEEETHSFLALNIAELTLQQKDGIDIRTLAPLFQLVQSVQSKKSGGQLSSIDALLGCPIIMPVVDIDLIENIDVQSMHGVLDCLFHCANWFRELLKTFSAQDEDLDKVLKRVLHLEEVEKNIVQIILKLNSPYSPPNVTFNINKYIGERNEKPNALSEANMKGKIELIENLPFRPLNMNIIQLFNNDLVDDSHSGLNIKMFKFLLKATISILEGVLISKIKRKTFLTKHESNVYDSKKAEKYATSICEMLPKLVSHMDFIIEYINRNNKESTEDGLKFVMSTEFVDHLISLEYIYNLLNVYFKWIGFRNNNALLKSALRCIVISSKHSTKDMLSLKDLVVLAVKILNNHEKLCLQLSTAVSLLVVMTTIANLCESGSVLLILRDIASKFLKFNWKTLDGTPERGLHFNNSIDNITAIYFLNSELTDLLLLTEELTSEVLCLKNRHTTLDSFKCFNKTNFSILYKNIGTAIYNGSKIKIDKGIEESEHLKLWKNVAITMQNMTKIVKILENRSNLSTFLKRSLLILKLFLSHGLPVIEKQLKNHTENVLETISLFQKTTRFLQSLCLHSLLKKDIALMNNIPQMRQILETLICKMKAILAANNCSEAFWLGNLKNKNIHGEVIPSLSETQESSDDEEQLPEDDEQLLSSDDELNANSNSVSDII